MGPCWAAKPPRRWRRREREGFPFSCGREGLARDGVLGEPFCFGGGRREGVVPSLTDWS